jgi:steroid 5-alpha reductase family enzyme
MTAPVVVLLATIGFMSVIWLISVRLRNASIVDIFWGAGFVAGAWIYLGLADARTARGWLVVGLVTLWGLRLSIHLLVRNLGKGEDYRYRAMRQRHGRRFWWVSFVTVYLLQGVIMWIVGLPLFVATRSATPNSLNSNSLTQVDFLGAAIFFAGLLFETLGDWQLTRFKADPANRGRLLTSGLWRYTRHPNYFGDALVWWGLALIALATPGTAWVLISPVLMTFLLMKVSGVSLLEQRMRESKPEFAEYMDRTSSFVPWFPRRSKQR